MKKTTAHAQVSKILKQAKHESWTELDLSEQKLSKAPPEIWELSALQVLDLSSNTLTELPKEIGQLTNLRELDLSTNQLQFLPESVGDLRQLQKLNAGSNRLKYLPESIGRLRDLQNLVLRLNDLTNLPTSVRLLNALEFLNVGSNNLTSLPGQPGDLPALKDLTIHHNQLTSIPIVIQGNKNLSTLWLTGNQIKELPDWLRDHTELKVFSIAANPLSQSADLIGSFLELERLDLASLKLQEFPTWLLGLSKLSFLFLDNNQLKAIPSSIEQLSQLEMLWLNRNELNDLPPSLGRLEKLSEFNVDDNPLNPVLASAAEQGIDALKAYLRSLEQAAPLYECKLVLVGEGDVGKTTLLKALTGNEPREGEKSTHGVSIDVQAMTLPHPEKPGVTIQFNAWDFGGQEVYRVTHQFFFSRRSIYLLVWEPRMGVQQCQVEDWLKLIRLRVSSEARVIIVSTHAKTGERIARIDRSVFLRDFGSMIYGFIEVDSLVDDPDTGEKQGIVELRNLIANTAKDLEQMGMPFNVQWRAARDELLTLGQTQPRATYAQFTEVCQRHSLTEIDTR
ncbi:MAG TPA: leucine-rich repeat domain-containing protein, partial [Pyrinomonadaceae bacterium]|nr:leucine-rich repeat domain-containing protein [Pyrinomonadaceae bacterium]